MKELLKKLSELMEMLKVLLENCGKGKEEPVVPQPKPEPETPVFPPPTPEPEIPQPEPRPEPENPTEEERKKFTAVDQANLMSFWGTNNEKYDLNKDGIVDGADLGLLLLNMEAEEKPTEPETKPQPKFEYELYSPHHELFTDEYLHQSKRNIFNTSEMDITLTQKLGVKKYYIYYPSGVSESEFNARKIDVSRIEQSVISSVGEDFEGIGMLDYEYDWFRALDKGADDEENKVTTDVLIEAIQWLKKRFPKMKWGFYDLPKMPYWLPHPSPTNSYTWANAPEELKERTMAFHEAAYSRLLKECDYMNVSRYHRYDPDVHTHDISPRECEWRKKCTDLAHRINKVNGTNLPIYAMYHQRYPTGGKAEFVGKLVQKDFMVDTLVKPHIESGVNGFMYWDANHYYAWTAIPTGNSAPNLSAANAFCKTFNYDYSSIPWAKGSGPEEERTKWRNKIVEEYSKEALSMIAHVQKYVRSI